MSLRSSLRLARAARLAAPVRTIVPRRYASTSSGSSGSNTPWAIGSAVVFGGLTTLILLPGSSHVDKVAASHDSPKSKESDHAREQQSAPTPEIITQSDSAEETPAAEGEGAPSTEEQKSTIQAMSADAPKAADVGEVDPPNVDDSNKPDDSEIKDSIVQGMKANAPEVAMDAEEKESK